MKYSRRFPLYSLLVSGCLLAGCGGPQSAPELVAEARRLVSEDHAELALGKLDRALRLDPSSAEAFVERAGIYNLLEEYEEAIADCDRALAIYAKNPLAFHHRGHAWRMQGDSEKGLADYGRALEIDPKHAPSLQERASLWAELGESEKVIADTTAALALEPNHVDSLFWRGTAWGNLKDYDQAERDLAAAIALDPQEADLYYQRGLCREQQLRFGDALSDHRQAIKCDAGYHWSHDAVARILLLPLPEIQDPTKAIEHARRACELGQWRHSSQIETLASVYAQQGDLEKAISFQRRAIDVASEGFPIERAKETLGRYEKRSKESGAK